MAAIRTDPASATARTQAFLVRAGVCDDGGQLFVNLSQLDGILSLTGDGTVARDALHALLDGILRTQPELPVAILDTPGGAGVTLPAGTMRVNAAELLQQSPPPSSGVPDSGGTLKMMARPRIAAWADRRTSCSDVAGDGANYSPSATPPGSAGPASSAGMSAARTGAGTRRRTAA